jgi:hypothetical protein
MTADLKFHPLADIFPLMGGEELDALVADIKANGLQQYIILYDGQVLDGRNRVRACLAAGWDPFAIREMSLNGDSWIDDPAAYVISVNIRRRHLTVEQKRDLIAAVLKAQPEKSNAAIAKQLGVTTDKTVATVRGELEGRSEIPSVETRTDTRGRKQPAKKAKPEAKAKLPKHDSRIIAPKLAYRVGRFAHDLILSERLLARELADIIMLPGVRERLSADLTNGLALMGNDADPETSADGSERTL